MKRLFGLAALLCLPAFVLGGYQIEHWTPNNGLPDNVVHCVLQDRNGYIWFATFNGLVRFDGVRFTVFDKGNTRGIKSNKFWCLYEDAAGDLWAGTSDDGVTRYHRGVFTTYTRTDDGRPMVWASAISGDRAGGLWALLLHRIVKFRHGRFVTVNASRFPVNGGRDVPVIHRGTGAGFMRSTANALWIFQRGKVSRWTPHDGLPGVVIEAAAEDERGALWLATNGGLVKITNGKLTRVPKPAACSPYSAITFTSSPRTELVCANREGSLSLFALNSSAHQTLSDLRANDLNGLLYSSVYRDREGDWWIGSSGGGLFLAQRRSVTVYAKAQGLAIRDAFEVLQDHTGAIWIGGWPRGVSRIKNGKIVNYTYQDGLSGGRVTSLYEDHEGQLWVGSYGKPYHSLRVFRNGHFVFPQGFDGLLGVNCMLQDHSGAMWFGTDEGLVRFSHGLRTNYTTRNGVASGTVRVIIEDRGGLWIGGDGGLTRFHNGKFTSYTQRNGLPGNGLDALYEDKSGTLWIGTHGAGLGRLKNGKFARFTLRDGLFSDTIFQILEDARGNLWMSSNQGIFRVKRQELNEFAGGKTRRITSIAYGANDGMLNVECNGSRSPAGIRARDGKLWFPTQDGVAVIDPATVPIDLLPPPVMIESCLIDRKPVPVNRTVRLKPGMANVEINYTALSFIHPAQLQFRYKLQGLDRHWISAGTRRTAYYSHLPPGHYLFRVIAANRDGVWNAEGKTLPIVILPPYYRTWWFLAMIIAVACCVTLLAWNYRVSQLERDNAAQQAFSRDLIASQELERKRIAAGLHDSLGQQLLIIKNWATLGLASPGDGQSLKEPLEEISSAAGQAIQEVRNVAYNLRPYELERLGLTVAIQDLVDHVAAASGIQFSPRLEEIDGEFSHEDEISVYRIIQEGLNNIARHSGASEAWLRTERADGEVVIVIRDNGRGFAPSSNGAREEGRHGFGLLGMAERARMLGGVMRVESAPGSGSMIHISLPSRGRAG